MTKKLASIFIHYPARQDNYVDNRLFRLLASQEEQQQSLCRVICIAS